ncbi:actin cytoskeleton-regulatory complex pan-like protein [Thalictrum thalictroides]|uniref:Actin cytoskeleton-regulatory complex pan-like protein n=1 Tax=Thalictrum thalictroides TaxID=46969 RepID=A0A7J6X236_THATH|nr:actin cytoskeleton-regulatory complex pan-like protein [Thalictrum thalictroides]
MEELEHGRSRKLLMMSRINWKEKGKIVIEWKMLIPSCSMNVLRPRYRQSVCSMQDYEKERKTRVLMEKVCDELAKEIGQDKAEVEAIKSESMKMCVVVDEERRILKTAKI